MKAGGRVEAYKDADGNDIGPLRIWVKEEQVPGLAMTRSFGDLVAASVGVSCEPEITGININLCRIYFNHKRSNNCHSLRRSLVIPWKRIRNHEAWILLLKWKAWLGMRLAAISITLCVESIVFGNRRHNSNYPVSFLRLMCILFFVIFKLMIAFNFVVFTE